MKKSIAIFLIDNFEDVEATVPYDIWTELGCDVDFIALSDKTKKITIISELGLNVICKKWLNDIKVDDYDGFFLPGGTGAYDMKENMKLKEFLLEAHQKEKLIGAICAGPTVLGKFGIVNNMHVTCHPMINPKNNPEACLEKAKINTNKTVIVDQNIITSQAPGTVYIFSFIFAEQLKIDKKLIKNIKHNIL